ncbi:SDR family oxidoreductase [Mucilaginibacter sp. BT774]|uniref:SDR family oxidoreductase n=1 Tax=Mucilaginibacter sp. BT774 TaxID=3062276 RepID=UPI002676332E|nr:SDR family oxidoreductase [Mucilaginibacter sp. BT774]MDO3626489.1 SDR family oxidoreductase [Mucilaginibacter sp. BT774]
MEDKETFVKSSLNGKRVVLIGGTSGFGLATAKAAAADNAGLVVVSSRQSSVDKALRALPDGTEGYVVDITDEQGVDELFKKIGEFDHLIFSAGETLQIGNLADANIADSRKFFNVRYWGALMAVKYGSPYIRKGGSIILTNGIVGIRPWKGWSVAASIAGAVESLTKGLAIDLAPIRVNAVCAGMVKTDLWNNIPEADREAMYNEVGSKLLTGRVGEAEDIAEAYIFLMKGNYTTGQVIVVDGGNVLV